MLVPALALIAAVTTSPADDVKVPPPADPPEADAFVYVGGALVCITTDKPSAGDGYRRCLHIDESYVGDAFADTVKRHGPAEADEPIGDGATAHVYVLDRREQSPAYIALTERKGRVVAVQLSGSGASRAAKLTFSGIHLGDPATRLRDRLGPPSTVEHQGGYDLWSWRPFPISIEVRDERVASIKVWEPG